MSMEIDEIELKTPDDAGDKAPPRQPQRYATTIEDDGFPDDWSPLHILVGKYVKTDIFDSIMVGIILSNIVVVVLEADASVDQDAPDWMIFLGYVYLAIYIVEICLRLYVERLSYFKSKFNLVDLFIVGTDLLCQIMIDSLVGEFPSITILRIFRVMRLVRIIRAFSGARELWLMLHGLAAAMKAMIWACVLIFVVLTIWSVVSVQSLHSIAKEVSALPPSDGGFNEECTRCSTAFSSVTRSMVTWFLLVFAGELWYDLAVPILEMRPLSAIVFLSAFVSINLGMLNLILTVIVDRASEARADDEHEKVEQKKREFNRATNQLTKICMEMDEDESGELTLEELETGFDTSEDFRNVLKVMDVGKDDIKTVFAILDEDKSGAVTYGEFVDQLHKMKSQESHTLLVFIKHYITDIRVKVTEQLGMLKEELQERDDGKEVELQRFRSEVMTEVGKVERSIGIRPEPDSLATFSNHFDSEGSKTESNILSNRKTRQSPSQLKESVVEPLSRYIDGTFALLLEEMNERSKQVMLLNESVSKLLERSASSSMGFSPELLERFSPEVLKAKEIGAVIVPIMMDKLGTDQVGGDGNLVVPVQVIRPGNGGRDRQFMV